jgi:ATP-dependent exoDNAse (exonuclease V) beta subunit
MPATAAAVATEVERLLAGAVVRDRSGPPRPARPDDIAILFRARAGHQYFEDALEARGIRTYVYKGLGFFDAPEVQDLQALLRYLAQPDSDLRAAELLRSRIVRLSDAALVQLAPSFARAILDARVELPALDEVDGRLLAALRASAPAWLALADRVTPSELIDRVLRETVYAVEMRGRRAAQARENVKKLRSLVRRVESRGYATLGRLARYFDTLRTGDESNAIVEAAGCVNLMTIHAAKGLEFPIVFVVNLHLPGRGRPAGLSVIEHGPDGQPAVAFGATPATALEDEREAEELRRLLYVAVTRARDRLYLAGEVDDQVRLRRGVRSLAALLPDSLGGIFSAAASDADATGVTWESGRGSFTFAVCRAAPDTGAPAAAAEAPPWEEKAAAPLASAIRRRDAATAVDPGRLAVVPSSDRLTGTLVHRLFQRALDPSLDAAAAAAMVPSLARADELVDVADLPEFAGRVAALYTAMRRRSEVASLLQGGHCRYEVPFSYAPPGRPDELIRGVIDCVVFDAEGGATVLEFKTGQPRPDHDAQAALYRDALASALGTDRIDVRILYP